MKAYTQISVAALLTSAVFLPNIAIAEPVDVRDLTFVSGKSGGLWYPLGAAAKNIIENNIEGASVSLQPGDGLVNIVSISSGRAQIGWTMALSSVDATKGEGAFAERGVQEGICDIATFYPNIAHLMTIDDTIQSIADLKGKDLGVLARGSTTEYAVRSLLSLNDLSYDDLGQVNYVSYGDQSNMIKDGQIDVMSGVTGLGTGAFLDVATARDVSLVPVSDEALARLQEANGAWKRMVIPAGTYKGQNEDVQSAGFSMHMVASCDGISEEVGYEITKAINENIDQFAAISNSLKGFTSEDLAADNGIPYHPGAERYYREVGVLK